MNSTDLPAVADAEAPREARPRRRASVSTGAVAVIVIGLLITGVLAFAARAVHENNEDRLLQQRVREAAAVVSVSFANIQTPLSSAAYLAEGTNGDPSAFRNLMQPLVGEQQTFQSASLWSTSATATGPISVVGLEPALATTPAAVRRAFLDSVVGARTVSLNDMLTAPDRRLGYALTVPANNARYVAYAEVLLPRDRRARIDSGSAFADFDYALFLGTKPNNAQLLASSTGGSSIRGRSDSVTIPFANSQLLVLMSPRHDLGGALLENLWWMLVVLGLSLTTAAAALVERVSRRRVQAEQLADDNARLYAAQRSVALALQHSLLSEDFPSLADVEIGARYEAGAEGIDIGGDWYDVVLVGDRRVVAAVGDVSGRGLPAATTMASLRFAMRAYAAEGNSPSEILQKLCRLVRVGREGHFATTLCAAIDFATHEITVANAGHPEPLLVADRETSFVATKVGLPVGIHAETSYREVTSALPESGTLLFYTDGLVERRGEILDEGLARLADAARESSGSLDALLTNILTRTIPGGSSDDAALLGIRWQ